MQGRCLGLLGLAPATPGTKENREYLGDTPKPRQGLRPCIPLARWEMEMYWGTPASPPAGRSLNPFGGWVGGEVWDTPYPLAGTRPLRGAPLAIPAATEKRGLQLCERINRQSYRCPR